jgi:hypothetical protein
VIGTVDRPPTNMKELQRTYDAANRHRSRANRAISP